jgi:hypothetical protein
VLEDLQIQQVQQQQYLDNRLQDMASMVHNLVATVHEQGTSIQALAKVVQKTGGQQSGMILALTSCVAAGHNGQLLTQDAIAALKLDIQHIPNVYQQLYDQLGDYITDERLREIRDQGNGEVADILQACWEHGVYRGPFADNMQDQVTGAMQAPLDAADRTQYRMDSQATAAHHAEQQAAEARRRAEYEAEVERARAAEDAAQRDEQRRHAEHQHAEQERVAAQMSREAEARQKASDQAHKQVKIDRLRAELATAEAGLVTADAVMAEAEPQGAQGPRGGQPHESQNGGHAPDFDPLAEEGQLPRAGQATVDGQLHDGHEDGQLDDGGPRPARP